MITKAERQMINILAMAYLDSVRRLDGGLPLQGRTHKEARDESYVAFNVYNAYLHSLEEKVIMPITRSRQRLHWDRGIAP